MAVSYKQPELRLFPKEPCPLYRMADRPSSLLLESRNAYSWRPMAIWIHWQLNMQMDMKKQPLKTKMLNKCVCVHIYKLYVHTIYIYIK